MKVLTHGSLFAGIGGFDLGFERAGIKTVWQVEIDPFCRKVLEKNFPHAERFDDIRGCGRHNLSRVDVIAGGFPCQPFSNAGRRKGKDDNRYLWPEMLRIISAVRPSFVVAENVSGLLSMQDGRVIDEILCSLEAEGYTTLPPLVLPACAFGAGHRRDRVWLIAHTQGEQDRRVRIGELQPDAGASSVTDSEREREPQSAGMQPKFGRRTINESEAADSYAEHNGPHSSKANAAEPRGNQPENWLPVRDVRHATITGFPDWAGGEMGQPEPLTEFERPGGREIERDFRGVAHGVSRRVDRLRSLGNAVVPQIAEWIGKRIVTCHEQTDVR